MTTPAALLRLALIALVSIACFLVALPAATPTPPAPAKRLPPAGIKIPDTARAELTSGASELGEASANLRTELARTPASARHLPLLADIEVLHKAVDWALRYDEFFDQKQIAIAQRMLALGRERVAQLRRGETPWLDARGLILRGHRSQLDGSVQPYGLFIPENLQRDRAPRLLVWLLGRGEKRSELAFLAEREAGPPQIVPRDTIVLVPYGRYCNATKFAGEVDVFEAMAAVRAQYGVDENRITVAGFSMGGASTWHLATHYAGMWCAASPGAGFAETAIYNKAFAPGKPARAPWEQTLWRWYDATGYAGNLFNVPLIAYSGELDPQKQSADLMEAAAAKEGLKLERLIGPKTEHKYHPETKKELTTRLETMADRGRDPLPREVRFTTYTTRYGGASWVRVIGLEKHWERADVRAWVDANQQTAVATRNVSALDFTAWDTLKGTSITIDGQKVEIPTPSKSDGDVVVAKIDGRWQTYNRGTFLAGRKVRGCSGPIDDAFMEPFLFVRPTGKPLNARVGAWVDAELAHATKLWRDIFRAELEVKDDTAVTAEDVASKNLILWGDASSNAVIARVLASKEVPLTWDAQRLTFRGKAYEAPHHAPIITFPNPLARGERMIVLNSGIDFREEAYGTNSLQVPKLPDYAIVDLREPPNSRWPGKIVDAGFFGEDWK